MVARTAINDNSSSYSSSPSPPQPIQLAIDLPRSLGTRVHLHLTLLANTALLFLSSSGVDSGPTAASMGSFVYAMPDRHNPTQPMSTALYSMPSSLDFTTRLAKVLVRRLQRPCYVASSVDLSGAVEGGTVDEEMEAFRRVVYVVARAAQRTRTTSSTTTPAS